MSTPFAVASPTAPRATRFLVDRVLGGAVGSTVVVSATVLAADALVGLALLAVGAPWVVAVLVAALVATASVVFAARFAYRLLGRLVGRLPGVFGYSEDLDLVLIAALVGVRDLRSPTAEALFARLVDSTDETRPSTWLGSTSSTTGVLLLAVVSRTEHFPLTEDLATVMLHAPLLSTWLPYPVGEKPGALVERHRAPLAALADDLRAGTPFEWALRRAAIEGVS